MVHCPSQLYCGTYADRSIGKTLQQLTLAGTAHQKHIREAAPCSDGLQQKQQQLQQHTERCLLLWVCVVQ